jgi:hypothetical protein
MNKLLIYVVSFLAAWIFMFIMAVIILGFVILILSFINWSLPLVIPFTWAIFRLLVAIALIFALFWSFSKENKDFVNETLKTLKGKENGNR